MLFRLSKNNFSPSQKMRMSSTKSTCVRKKFVEIWMPLKRPCDTTFEMSLLNLFSTIKSSGERGHAYMSPLSALKKGDVEPFMSMTKVVVEIQLRI
jgi:hypothetical protein